MGEIVPIDRLEGLGNELRRHGKSVVFTNGHFDLLHVGHLHYLQQARALGDVLIVGINDDATTTSRKGPRRPVLPESDRAELVAGLACVDYVVIFHDETADKTIELLRPDVYVKGGDYTLDPGDVGTLLPEAETVQRYGGSVEILPLIRGQSTSAIERRIIDLWRKYEPDAP